MSCDGFKFVWNLYKESPEFDTELKEILNFSEQAREKYVNHINKINSCKIKNKKKYAQFILKK